jgi:plasmid stabilization system protein ParE
MSAKQRQKFATQVDADLIEAVRSIAREEGRQVQSLIDEALADLIEKRRLGKPRKHIMTAYQASIQRYGKLYKKLAE